MVGHITDYLAYRSFDHAAARPNPSKAEDPRVVATAGAGRWDYAEFEFA